LHLLAVDIEVELRRAGRVGGEHRFQRRILVGSENERARDGGDIGWARPSEAFELILKAAACSKPDDRRQVSLVLQSRSA
jgi:hypothetical protein